MTDPSVRVRFAPSPTGYLHVGGARTALFNWLLARKHGGQLVLRIEDTDQKREVGDSLPKILDDLRWLGLDWDEGPESGGGATGDSGPYFQSKRLDLYDKYCQQLLDSGDAYYAFDTPEELAAMREEAKRKKKTFKYPRPQTFATADDAERARADGKPAVVRFKMPDHDITVIDTILGEVTLSKDDLEDFVIRKADGFPTYHFACVVDDELMKISHVLRGSEHLNNTPKHIAMQQALGFATPVYAHMPIIMNMSGSKMSKRDKEKAVAKGEPPPEIDVHDFRAAGFLPEALLNFIALLGWSPGDDREHFTLDELVEAFTLERIGKTSAKFDRDKLLSFNTDWAAKLPSDRLLEAFRDYLQLRIADCGLTSASSVEPRIEEQQSRDREGADPESRSAFPPGLLTADDATLARVLEVCKGFRTCADVVTK
ncbi:MAG: glutamate--tRNA ligase, partial [Planctomycetes bacterium]|nr:glutamate--tRNA ligase [Planctomycetota bacterium]